VQTQAHVPMMFPARLRRQRCGSAAAAWHAFLTNAGKQDLRMNFGEAELRNFNPDFNPLMPRSELLNQLLRLRGGAHRYVDVKLTKKKLSFGYFG